MKSLIVSLLLVGYVSSSPADFLLFVESNDPCIGYQAMQYVLAAKPSCWKKRFKEIQRYDYLYPILANQPKLVKRLIIQAHSFGIDLE